MVSVKYLRGKIIIINLVHNITHNITVKASSMIQYAFEQ